MINNALKKLISVKTENILFILYVFYMIINISKSKQGFLIASCILHLVLLIGVYLTTRLIRQDVKQYVYNMDQIKLIDIKAIKKEIFIKVFNLLPTTAQIKYIKPFLNNSN